MSAVISVVTGSKRKRLGSCVLVICACATLALPMAAQRQGPLPPPPGTVVPSSVPAESAKTSAPRQEGSSRINTDAPAVPVQEIIQKFTEHEDEFRKERENYTYTQFVVMQTIDDDGQPDGEYRLTSDILFTPSGKRYQKDTFAPVSTLSRIQMSQEDFNDIEKVWPLVMTPNELPKYDVKYVGRERVDEVGTYVFDITPLKMEKGQRYFQGRVWVDDKDLQIVKTRGKATGLLKKKEDQAFPTFETFRENIEGHFWFPTYTRADDVLHFKTGPDVRIRVSVKYTNYQRFGSTIKIGKPTQVDPEKP
jgi:hypothetical protein